MDRGGRGGRGGRACWARDPGAALAAAWQAAGLAAGGGLPAARQPPPPPSHIHAQTHSTHLLARLQLPFLHEVVLPRVLDAQVVVRQLGVNPQPPARSKEAGGGSSTTSQAAAIKQGLARGEGPAAATRANRCGHSLYRGAGAGRGSPQLTP
jgi:hypothetical protein